MINKYILLMINKINTLYKLGEIITDNIHSEIPLKDLSNIVSSYDGTDWKNHIIIDEKIPY